MVVQLGNCLDFLDISAIAALQDAWSLVYETYLHLDTPIPVNRSVHGSNDILLRDRDCMVINIATETAARTGNTIQTVRGCFQEGEPAFPGSEIMQKSHVQIAVRDLSCITGYFSPSEPEA